MGDGNTMSEYRNKKAMGILNWILGGCKTAKDIMKINENLKIGELYFAHRFDMDKDKELGIINRIYEAPIPPFGIIEIYNPLANEIELENKYGSAYYETTELEKQHHFANEIVQLDLSKINDSDILLAYLEPNQQQIGTLYEVFYSSSQRNLTFVIYEKPHPFLLTYDTINWFWFHTMDEYVETMKLVKEMYDYIIKTISSNEDNLDKQSLIDEAYRHIMGE